MDYADAQRMALQQGRHLDTVIVATMSLVAVLGTGGALAFSAIYEPAEAGADSVVKSAHELSTALGAAAIFVPLLIAFWVASFAIISDSVLIPHPNPVAQAATMATSAPAFEPDQYCLQNTIFQNRRRKTMLNAAWIPILFAVTSFGTWASQRLDAPQDLGDAVAQNALGIVAASLSLGVVTWSVVWSITRKPWPRQKEALATGKVLALDHKGTLFTAASQARMQRSSCETPQPDVRMRFELDIENT